MIDQIWKKIPQIHRNMDMVVRGGHNNLNVEIEYVP